MPMGSSPAMTGGAVPNRGFIHEGSAPPVATDTVGPFGRPHRAQGWRGGCARNQDHTGGRKRRQTACKPGSVRAARLPGTARDGHSSGTRLAARLARPTRTAGRETPGGTPARAGPAGRPYSVLLPVGFTLPPPLPGARCALAAPFHPCPWRPAVKPCGAGGLFSVALSLGSPPPAVSRHRLPVEPGLSSTTGGEPRRQRPSGRLARQAMGARGAGVKRAPARG